MSDICILAHLTMMAGGRGTSPQQYGDTETIEHFFSKYVLWNPIHL